MWDNMCHKVQSQRKKNVATTGHTRPQSKGFTNAAPSCNKLPIQTPPSQSCTLCWHQAKQLGKELVCTWCHHETQKLSLSKRQAQQRSGDHCLSHSGSWAITNMMAPGLNLDTMTTVKHTQGQTQTKLRCWWRGVMASQTYGQLAADVVPLGLLVTHLSNIYALVKHPPNRTTGQPTDSMRTNYIDCCP